MTTISEALKVPRRSIRTFIQQFIGTEASSGILLIACTVFALIWANSPAAGLYTALWNTHFVIGVGRFVLDESLLHWINDGLMAVFFFVVGLEIKREILTGELSSVRRAMLPAAAAIGGMLVPALIYVLVVNGGEGSRGWGIPMATDIAFSLGVLTLLGSRAPLPLKIFLTGLAIVDDLGAVLVIAFFYSGGVNFIALLIAAGVMLVLVLMNVGRVRHPTPYLLVGIVLWLAVYESGVHATIAGVLLAMTIPARVHVNTAQFLSETHQALDDFESAGAPGDDVLLRGERRQFAAILLDEASEKIESPLHRLEHELHPWVSRFILPVFALANAGVSLVGGDFGAALAHPIALGIIMGLLLGKPVGILLLSWLAVKLRLAEMPAGIEWRHLIGASILAGIGFTMSIFITTLALQSEALIAAAKIAIILASLIAGVAGFMLLYFMTAQTSEEAAEQQA